MALNPPATDGLPHVFAGEVFILVRRGMDFEAKDSGGAKWSGSGSLHMSTIRMVWLSKNGQLGFDVPLANLRGERFNQPIFGANNLEFNVDAIPGEGVNGAARVKLYFKEGGCSAFLPIFFRSLGEMRDAETEVSQNPLQTAMAQEVVAGTFQSSAFMDPSDPTTLYVAQPIAPPAAPAPAYPRQGLAAPLLGDDPDLLSADATMAYPTDQQDQQQGYTPPVLAIPLAL